MIGFHAVNAEEFRKSLRRVRSILESFEDFFRWLEAT